MKETPIQNVTDTAFWVAAYRAIESERNDALFRDPLANRLAGERGRKIAAQILNTVTFGWIVVIRTYIINRYIMEAIEQGVDTVLNLGAGLDTRPYWMSLPPSLRWIEVDYPQLVDDKTNQLRTETPRCRLERVKLDLSRHAARKSLLEDINSKSKKVLVLTEGLIPYLSLEEAASLVSDLRSQSRFQLLIADYFSPDARKFHETKQFKNQMRWAPYKFQPPDWVSFFEAQGWMLKELHYIGIEGEKLKRPIVLPWWAKIIRRLMSSRRRERFNRMSGYALLQPKI